MHKIFRIYIDESGDHSYGKKELRKWSITAGADTIEVDIDHYPELEMPDKRYLGLTGCVINQEKYRAIFHPRLEELKQAHFPHNPDEPLVLHRTEILNKRSSFWRLREPAREKAFNESILAFFAEMEYSIITVVINKKAHVERYQSFAYHPYHYCLGAMLERYCGFLHFNNAKGDVMAESRGGSENRQLQEAYRSIYNSGTQFRKPEFFQSVLTSREIKLKPKSANIAGIQAADLIAHPLKMEILLEQGRITERNEEIFGGKVCEVLKKKHNRQVYSGKVYGYGKVFIK